MKKLISAVVPCYNEEESLPLFYRRIRSVAETLPEADFEFVFVDDGSRDGTLRILRELDSAAPGALRSMRSSAGSPATPPRVCVPGNSASIRANIAPGRWAAPSDPLSGQDRLT